MPCEDDKPEYADNTVIGVKIKNTVENTEKEIRTDDVFISIGRYPQTEF